MKKTLKSLIVVAILSLGVYANGNGIERLSNTNETYRASIKNDTVLFNIIGKTALARTNLTGWLNLKTNLLNSGYTLKVERVHQLPPAKGYITEDIITRQRRLDDEEMARREKARQDAIARQMVERAGLIGYQMKKREERIAEGLSYLQREQ